MGRDFRPLATLGVTVGGGVTKRDDGAALPRAWDEREAAGRPFHGLGAILRQVQDERGGWWVPGGKPGILRHILRIRPAT